MSFSPRLVVGAIIAMAAVSGFALAADAPGGAPGCPAPGSKDVAYIKNPKWLHQASGDDVTKAYPPFAYKGHKNDRTVMDCAVADDGGLTDCTVVDDKRPKMGFDKAALSLTKLFKTAPLSEQSAYTGLPECIRKLGAPHVIIPMDWSAGG